LYVVFYCFELLFLLLLLVRSAISMIVLFLAYLTMLFIGKTTYVRISGSVKNESQRFGSHTYSTIAEFVCRD
jgi:hypothetical protein